MSSSRKMAGIALKDEDRRIARERVLIEQARASIAAGDVVPDGEIDAWLDHMVDGDRPMPIPEAGDRGRTVGS